MKIINHVQSSIEWLLWRQDRITATSASILMGLNRFKTLNDLWEEMLGIKPPEPLNDKMRRGQELEPIARDLFIKETGIEVTPICCEHDTEWWMAASLDGISQDHTIVCEIKCPKLKTHKEAIDGIIPDYYYAQMQHQLFVTGASRVLYTSYHPEHSQKLFIKDIKPNQEFINELRERSKYFYHNNICQMRSPFSELETLLLDSKH